jgi:hypothetical protein
VAGLIGVVTDAYAAPDGTCYALARMHRADSVARYTALVRENDAVIASLKGDAAARPGTFDAYAALAFARDIAVVTDNFLSILSVLDRNARDHVTVTYGTAAALTALAQTAARAILVTVKVTDAVEGGRAAKAFAKVFTDRGFRTAAAAPYVLRAKTALERADFPGNPNAFARYTITASLADSSGAEILTWTGVLREGHRTYSEAIQSAIRAADAAITEADDGFAVAFDAYLESLLH